MVPPEAASITPHIVYNDNAHIFCYGTHCGVSSPILSSLFPFESLMHLATNPPFCVSRAIGTNRNL